MVEWEASRVEEGELSRVEEGKAFERVAVEGVREEAMGGQGVLVMLVVLMMVVMGQRRERALGGRGSWWNRMWPSPHYSPCAPWRASPAPRRLPLPQPAAAS